MDPKKGEAGKYSSGYATKNGALCPFLLLAFIVLTYVTLYCFAIIELIDSKLDSVFC